MGVIIDNPEQAEQSQKGWQANLDLEITSRNGRSVVSGSRQQGPLTIQRPFYPESNVCHLYLLHPPAGIVGGDRLKLNVSASQLGAALITTPGATKFYRTSVNEASQTQTFAIAEGASIEWLPQETIYFPDANAQVMTQVNLEGVGTFLGWDIHCLGRPANKLDFGSGKARIGLQIHRNGNPLLLESLEITPEKKLHSSAFLQEQPVLGSFIATNTDQAALDLLRKQLKPARHGLWGATLLQDLLVVRYLGSSVNENKAIFFKIWKTLRPLILGRKSVVPRIWAT